MLTKRLNLSCRLASLALATGLFAGGSARALDAIYPRNDGFEVPDLGAEPSKSFKYWNELTKEQASGLGWVFTGSAGIAANNSFFNVTGADNANGDGTKSAAGQVGFVTGKGSLAQKISLPAKGQAVLSFKLASRGNQDKETNPFDVRLDDAIVGTFTPKLGGGFVVWHVPLTHTGGTCLISFTGTNGTGDPTTFVDDVKITVAAPGESLPPELSTRADLPPLTRPVPPDLPLPPQPVTVELLDLYRGQFSFRDALGQSVELASKVPAAVPAKGLSGELQLAYLCCDPGFPDDPSHAELKICQSRAGKGEPPSFKIDEIYFQADISTEVPANTVLRCELKNVVLGSTKSGDRYLAGIYLLAGTHFEPLWFVPPSPSREKKLVAKLTTGRVGHAFTAGEAVELSLDILAGETPPPKNWKLRAIDYATGEEVWSEDLVVAGGRGPLVRTPFRFPVQKFGVMKITASCQGTDAELRVVRVPEPRAGIDPDKATVGMNIFQQQIWWYAYQSPLLARAGVHWIRPWLNTENVWPTVEPRRGQWDTRALDAALRRMALAGQEYECILFGCPDWVAPSGSRIPIAKFDLWDAYVEHLVSSYKGKINHFEVWNEPDDPRYQKNDPALTNETGLTGNAWYLKLLAETYQIAKKTNPDVVIDGISHAGVKAWLRTLSDTDAAKYMDVATLHSYTPAAAFAKDLRQREGMLGAGGWDERPIWTNEFGSPAYDFSEEYSQTFDCTEKGQAADLTAKYAQALALGTGAKAFWFCSYDPRDSAHPAQSTGDSAIGVLYQGFLPKLSYAALAGVSQELDGRACLGQTRRAGVSQASFAGPVAVAWQDALAVKKTVPASELGCYAGESIVVKDLYTNRVAAGPAGGVTLDFSHGPLYIEGSKGMADLAIGTESERKAQAAVEAPVKLSREEASIPPGGRAEVQLTYPKNGLVKILAQSAMPARVDLRAGSSTARLILTADQDAPRANANVTLEITMPDSPRAVRRNVNVEIGTPSLVRNGSVSTDDFGDWTIERNSCFIWDGSEGHNAPGSLEITAPFDGRIRQNLAGFKTDRNAKFSLWIKGPPALPAVLRIVLACFSQGGDWVGDVTLASSDARASQGTGTAAITTQSADWTQVATDLDKTSLPDRTASVVFYIDVKGGGKEPIRLDDIDLWQP